MKPFLRWLIMATVISVGGYVFVLTGKVWDVYGADLYKISFLIYALFLFFTLRTGVDTFKICRNRVCEFQKRNDLSWFVADLFIALGLLGTLVGLVIIMSIDSTKSKEAIIQGIQMGSGTAIYTTISGLVCWIALRVQLYNLESCIENK